MQQYTMTFLLEGEFDLPNDQKTLQKNTPAMVLEKMQNHEFELIDFNLSRNYDQEYAETYIEDPTLKRCILEITIGLEPQELESREQIYDRCVQALRKNKLSLDTAIEREDADQHQQQSIISFSDQKHDT